jgi:regulator of protease activity HflC (stomatin/prohibitin superfamily)
MSSAKPRPMLPVRNNKWLFIAAPIAVLFFGLVVYSNCVINVPTGHAAILIRKVGDDLKNNEEIAPTPEHRGVQREMLGEGRHWPVNPYVWDWEIVPLEEVGEHEFGVRVRLVGNDLDYGELVANNEDQKGIVRGYLKPGKYAINRFVERIERYEPIDVPAGSLGVLTNLSGPLAEKPNQILVPLGFRGTQAETLPPGRYFPNPYLERIHLIDCRSQRFNLAEQGDMGFPSKDGFWVRLDGIIEFRVKETHAAEIFAIYNETANGDRVDEELVRKVILPNARSFCRLEGSNSLGRDFIQGDTRAKFQHNFQAAMQKACDPLGVEIIQALITNIYPPEQIAKPVRQRELAKQDEKQYQQQILQQESEVKLAVEKENVKQKPALVGAEQEVVKQTVQATREQEVAVTKSQEALAVAKLQLEAAKDEAAAVTSRGQAAAKVVELQNKAEAAGWERAVKAFNGDGAQYAQYVLFDKMAAAYRTIMVNTADSPIMKIFESFTPDRPAAPAPATKR